MYIHFKLGKSANQEFFHIVLQISFRKRFSIICRDHSGNSSSFNQEHHTELVCSRILCFCSPVEKLPILLSSNLIEIILNIRIHITLQSTKDVMFALRMGSRLGSPCAWAGFLCSKSKSIWWRISLISDPVPCHSWDRHPEALNEKKMDDVQTYPTM